MISADALATVAQFIAACFALYWVAGVVTGIRRERRLMRNLAEIEGRELGEPAPRESVRRAPWCESTYHNNECAMGLGMPEDAP